MSDSYFIDLAEIVVEASMTQGCIGCISPIIFKFLNLLETLTVMHDIYLGLGYRKTD